MGGEEVLFIFIPETTGTYSIFSTGDLDPMGYLYDVSFMYLTDNDDNELGFNFEIVYTLEAGETYYISTGIIDLSETGTYSIYVELHEIIT